MATAGVFGPPGTHTTCLGLSPAKPEYYAHAKLFGSQLNTLGTIDSLQSLHFLFNAFLHSTLATSFLYLLIYTLLFIASFGSHCTQRAILIAMRRSNATT